jgi:hypothetical protein
MSEEKRFSENISKREEDIAAYAAGIMSPAETAEFEKLLQKDESLRMELEEYRNALNMVRTWMNEESPGIERIQSMQCPVPSSSRILDISSIRRTLFIRTLAAAAIFILGFFIGIWVTRNQGGQKASSIPNHEQEARAPQFPEKIQSTPVPFKPEEFRKDEPGIERRVTRQNGRLIIETTQSGAETRSIWVVDASLKIANLSR